VDGCDYGIGICCAEAEKLMVALNWCAHPVSRHFEDAMANFDNKMSRIARCIALAGSVPAGVLLYRIAWWNTQPKVQFGREFWIVHSHALWGIDTGLTPKQLRDAFAQLKQLGLIKSEKHLWEDRIYAFLQLTGEAVGASPIGDHPD
jgi:hypothetical protein